MATILCVVGARPNFMKVAPVLAALADHPRLRGHLVHTGQHYDAAMSARFFEELGIPPPDENLEVGSGSHAVQTAQVMTRIEPVIDRLRPACLLVVGDVNSTLAAALVAAKKGIPVAHVEAGLRSGDRTMPEEINRILTDQISDLLFTTEAGARVNLLREGIGEERIHFVGNVMIDTLLAGLPRAVPPAETLRQAGVDPAVVEGGAGYVVATLHRPSNVDDTETLGRLLSGLRDVARRRPVLFPVHPRTRRGLERLGSMAVLPALGIHPLPPLGYLAMLGLMRDAVAVVTDSGGMQEETTALGVPCFTLRPNTERPITVEQGTNLLVGTDPERLARAFDDLLRTGGKRGRVPELWDGSAGRRIVEVLGRVFGG